MEKKKLSPVEKLIARLESQIVFKKKKIAAYQATTKEVVGKINEEISILQLQLKALRKGK